MFGDVIVPLDGSPESARAIGPAAMLARALDSALVPTAITTPGNHTEVEEAVTAQLADLADVKIAPHIEQADGSAADEIAKLVEAAPSSLVCMTTKGRGRAAGLTGSVATKLLRKLSGPVLLVGPSCDVDAFEIGGPLVVAVDDSARSNAILPIAESWAIVFGYSPEVVTVLGHKTDEALRAARRAEPVGDVAMDTVMVRRIARAMEDVIGTPVGFESLHGAHPAAEILRYSATRGATLIAMATHGETGVNRLVFGSIAAATVHGSTCPVLAIRPIDLL